MENIIRIVTAAGVWACALLIALSLIVAVARPSDVTADDIRDRAIMGAVDAQAAISGIDDSDGRSESESRLFIESLALRDGYLKLAGMDIQEFFALIRRDGEMREYFSTDPPDPDI